MMEWVLLISWVIIGILVFLLAYMLKNPEKAEGIAALLSRMFASRSLRFDKAYVALDIQSKLNDFSKTVNSETVDIMPYPAKIEWVKTMNRQTLIENNEIVIKLNGHNEQKKNLVYATVAYVTSGLLPYSRQYIDESIMKSCDLVVTAKLLRKEKRGVLEFFFDEFLSPIMKDQPEVKKYTGLMVRLDNHGLLTRILLRELWDVGRRLYPRAPTRSIKQETVDLVEMLGRLVEKRKGVDISPTIETENVKMSIMLIARPEVVASYGIDPYLKYINKCLERGIYTIHILARGPINISVAKVVAQHYENSMKIEKIEETKIPGNKASEGVHILFKERIR
jgi:hypothetical protein